jgi:uncharacterized protein YndB with AHSA1/START domain
MFIQTSNWQVKEGRIMQTATLTTSATPTVNHSTFVIERVFAAKPARVFAAFADPARKKYWFTEGYNKEPDTFEMDFRVGGAETFRYHYGEGSPIAGMSICNEGIFQNIVPNRRIVNSSTMSAGDKCFSASLTTFELLPEDSGTKLIFTFQGAFFEGADGPQIREMGWNKLIDRIGEELTRP